MFRASVVNVSVYGAVVFTTAVLCLFSFANAENFSPQYAKEITHYWAGEDFICSRNATDDVTGIPQNTVATTVLVWQFIAIPQEVIPALQNCHTLNDIRGPPAPASLL